MWPIGVKAEGRGSLVVLGRGGDSRGKLWRWVVRWVDVMGEGVRTFFES